ncbi:MAG TPA: alpha-hydroxy-acid oxidizing protein, partial [Solirubrobacterales bacterium]|nr:alpha-hydroxy-acid oxidizing protein [Solirubrobacterales bacterium]
APVLFDGGCRCGADVVTALALGASAVGLGRAPLWGLALAGAAGAARVLEIVRAEVRETLTMTGSASVAELGPRTLIDAAEYEVRAY